MYPSIHPPHKSMVELASIPYVYLQTFEDPPTILLTQTWNLACGRTPHRVSIPQTAGQSPQTNQVSMTIIYPVIIRQVWSNHRRFKKSGGNINLHPPDDISPTLAEDLSPDVIKCKVIGLHLQHQTCILLPETRNTQYQSPNTTEINISRSIQAGTAIVVSDGSFKNRWGTAALIIKGGKTSHPRITATRTTPVHQ